MTRLEAGVQTSARRVRLPKNYFKYFLCTWWTEIIPGRQKRVRRCPL